MLIKSKTAIWTFNKSEWIASLTGFQFKHRKQSKVEEGSYVGAKNEHKEKFS